MDTIIMIELEVIFITIIIVFIILLLQSFSHMF